MSTFTEKFNFKKVKTDEKKYADTVAQFSANGIQVIEHKNDAGELESIQRVSESLDLPSIDVVELATKSPSFVASVMNDLVVKTARKLYVDACKPLGAITLDDIIAANTPTPKASVSADMLKALSAFYRQCAEQAGQAPAAIDIVGELIAGRFNSGVLRKYAKLSDAMPTILGRVVSYVDQVAEQVGDNAEMAAQVDQYQECVTLLQKNYAAFLEAEAAQTEELDLSAF